MKFTQLFTKTKRDFPSDESSKNAQLFIKAGYIHKTMAGVYSYLPLGIRTIAKIENIVRKGMNEVGGQEILMNNLQPKDWWVRADNRWDKVDVLFKVPSQTKVEYALNQSNEEQVTMISKDFINSYKDMPEYTGSKAFANNDEAKNFIDKLENQLKKDSSNQLCVDCFIQNQNGQILLQKRSSSRKLFPNSWDIIGGHVDDGDTAFDTILKEVREELSVEVDKIKSFERIVYWQGQNKTICQFAITLKAGEIKLEKEKATEYGYFDNANVEELKKVEGDNYIYNSVKFVLNKPEITQPLAIYQIQNKFRDEIRSKAGLMRGREFVMKDMYDFHISKESQDSYYEIVRQKYSEIYQNLGLEAHSTRASGGAFSKFSHEFQVVTPAGEDWLVQWSDGVMDNLEISKGCPNDTNKISGGEKTLRENLTDEVKSAKEHSQNAKVEIAKILKTVMYCNQNKEYLGICIRGDLEINEELFIQATEELGSFEIATQTQLEELGTTRGRTTSVLDICKDYTKQVTWIFDKSIEGACDMVASLYKAVDVVRDCAVPLKYDFLAIVKVGFVRDDSKATCQAVLRSAEVGNIFKLGNKWSKKGSLEIPYITKENTQDFVPFMSCYGIGVSRCMGVLGEIYSDEKGLKLPKQVAPFDLHLITQLDKNDSVLNAKILAIANRIYAGELKLVQNKNSQYRLIDTENLSDISDFTMQDLVAVQEVLWDDRSGKISLGEKLKDADLLGMPLQLIVTKRGLENGTLEIIERATNTKFEVRI